MAKTGRPSTARFETVAVCHLDTDATVAWSDGQFGGDPILRDAARAIRDAAQPVTLGTTTYPMTDGPRGAAVAMLAACTGRGVIVTDPGILTEGDDEQQVQDPADV